MDFPWNILAIPEQCYLGKRVFKKLFYEHVRLTATDKKSFSEDIAHILLKYSLKPANCGIPSVEEDDFSYGEILVIETELQKGTTARLKRTAEIMQRGIPYPLLIIFRCEALVYFSTAEKRYSQADEQSATIKTLRITDGFNSDVLLQEQEAFLYEMAYGNQPRIHLKAFYSNWLECFRAYETAGISGNFTIAGDDDDRSYRANRLEAYRNIEDQLFTLRVQLKKAQSFNEKVSLNTKIHDLKKQLTELKQDL
ncbi:MAG: DUF4391 domain-containing protein [Balneolales bacterium]|nr:DUF4391 domain-containing protein [Balneolales bacterium]